jgi:Zn-dependent protease
MRSLYLGRAFGIPLYLHWTIVLLPLYVFWTTHEDSLAAILLSECVVFTLFGCVLLHELGHALMARTFHIRTRDITLYPIGGVARLESMGQGPFQEVCIALAGPAVNLILVCLLFPVVLAAFFLIGPVSIDPKASCSSTCCLRSRWMVAASSAPSSPSRSA